MVDISILVISYNHEKYISDTFESIINQSTKYTYEILVGDDCSKDGTLNVINDYQRRYPDIIKNINRSENMGASANLYDLICRANGRYIAFCEGDDYWCDENRIESEVGYLDDNQNYIGMCGRTIPVDEDGIELSLEQIPLEKRFWVFDEPEYNINDFSDWKMPGHLSAITIRNFYSNAKHDYSIIPNAHGIVADRTIALTAVLNGNIRCYNDVVSCYRFRVKAGSGNFMSLMVQNNFRLDDFMMLRRIENYSKSEFAKSVSLESIKKDRLVGATVLWLRDRSAVNREVVKGIIGNSGNSMLYGLYFARIVITKLFYWKVLKQDKRIKL